MSAFTFSALDASGKTQNGVLEADNDRHVREQIRRKGWVPLAVALGSQPTTENSKGSFFQGRIRPAELAIITRQLATLIQSGMPLAESLQTIGAQSEKQSSRAIILAIRSRVTEGRSLADALREQSRSIPTTYCEMVAAGEASGHLDVVLEQLSEHLESNTDSQQQVKLALIYPAVLLSVSLLMVLGLLTYVVPQIVGVFTEQGAALPALTQAMITSSEFLQAHAIKLLLGVVILVFAARKMLSTEAVAIKVDRWLLRSFLCKRLFRVSVTSQFSSTLSILVRSGIPLVEAMKIAQRSMPNLWLQQRLSTAIRKLEEGGSLKDSLQECPEFSPMLTHMVASGEAGGDLGNCLAKAAEHEQRNLSYQINRGLKLLEPAVLLVMGGLIFTIVLAILQPVFELNQLI